MRSTSHSSSSSSPREDQRSPLKSTPKSTLTFTRTLTPTWTGKYISINTFIFSVSLSAKYPSLTAPASQRDNELWTEQQLLSDSHLALLFKKTVRLFSQPEIVGRVCTWEKTVASDTHLVFLHPNFHIWCFIFFSLPVRSSHH